MAIQASADGRYLLVTLPYELWVVDARTLGVQRTIALDMPRPSVAEGWEGTLWIGGQHLHRGNLHASTTSKVGSKLGGWVDHVGLIRADLLCGVGDQGELLWDIDREAPTHQRKSTGREPLALVVSKDERAVFSEGSSNCWVIDPTYKLGYAQLKLAATSSVPVEREAIVCLGKTLEHRLVLAARDGALAWTNPDLRLAGERAPAELLRGRTSESEPLALTGDERWVYVLRPKGLLQRFLIAQPIPAKKPDKRRDKGKLKDHGRKPEAEPEPLPEAQEVRLDKIASCILIIPDDAEPGESDVEAAQDEGAPAKDPKKLLVLGGGRANDQLGRIWTLDPESLAWETLALGQRTLVEPEPEPEPSEPAPPQKPSFIATKNKLAGPKLHEIGVDDIVGDKVAFWLTHGHGSLLERPTEQRPIAEVLPGDAIVLPAMVRFAEGTARPALLVWPGVVEDHEGEPAKPQWLVWGDEPRGWMSLDTPAIRKQKWSRTDVFPMQAALAGVPEGLPGKRAKIDERWVDRGHFEVLAKECKRLLKVLW
ncbi:hypothetical protein ACNOYE_16470 [Nannocystaceae bacterium ST9]